MEDMLMNQIDSLERQAISRDEYVLVHRQTQHEYMQRGEDYDETMQEAQDRQDYEIFECMNLIEEVRQEWV